jgi:glucose-1-phosphate cytidylyltransferase
MGLDSVLEREPLRGLAADGQLRAHRHQGFWECMDTYKDAVLLNDMWGAGEAPWRRLEEEERLAQEEARSAQEGRSGQEEGRLAQEGRSGQEEARLAQEAALSRLAR